jgi:hypothetical protein
LVKLVRGTDAGVSMSLARIIAIGLFCGTTFLGWAVLAEPLDKESCANLQSERKQLLNRDMQAALDQGPDWVKSHLSEPEIDRVRKFLAIEEQIEFRCRGGGITKAKASQALADSDKTAPSKPKATR